MNAVVASQEITQAVAPFTLPKIGSAFGGGLYAGIIRGVDGEPDQHLVLLEVDAEDIKWGDAMTWAADKDGDLPTRSEQALLFANLPEQFKKDWYWSNTQHAGDSDFAWGQLFSNGNQGYIRKSCAGRARAVRRFKI